MSLSFLSCIMGITTAALPWNGSTGVSRLGIQTLALTPTSYDTLKVTTLV